MIDRSEVNRALAKAIAYKHCGKDQMAHAWAVELIRILECSQVLSNGAIVDAAKVLQSSRE